MKKQKTVNNHNSRCVICGSRNTYQWYKGEANVKSLSFTYEFSPNAKKTFRVVRCNNCSHVFCNPIPKNIYKYYKDVIDHNYLTQEIDRKITARKLVDEIHKYKKSGTILDIGCATGDFLEVARGKGYKVEGLELSTWSAEISKKKGIKIYSHSLTTHAKRYKNKYDLITLWGVIEHFENPLKEMMNINKLLKPGGLVMLWTGDVDSITSKIMGRNWWYWLGQHIQYFTRDSLRLCGINAGLEQVYSKTYPQVVTYDKVKNSMARYKNQQLLLIFKLLFFIKKTWFVKLPGEIFWMARKNAKN